MRWRTAHARHRRAERRFVEFQKALDLHLMMEAYALMDEVVGGVVRRLVGEVVAMQGFMGLSAGGASEPGHAPWPLICDYVVPASHPLVQRSSARACAGAAAAAIAPHRRKHKTAVAGKNVSRTKRESANPQRKKCQP